MEFQRRLIFGLVLISLVSSILTLILPMLSIEQNGKETLYSASNIQSGSFNGLNYSYNLLELLYTAIAISILMLGIIIFFRESQYFGISAILSIVLTFISYQAIMVTNDFIDFVKFNFLLENAFSDKSNIKKDIGYYSLFILILSSIANAVIVVYSEFIKKKPAE